MGRSIPDHFRSLYSLDPGEHNRLHHYPRLLKQPHRNLRFRLVDPHAIKMNEPKGESIMYGIFGGYTRWAVVFLIIFVLFFLLVPIYGPTGGAVADP